MLDHLNPNLLGFIAAFFISSARVCYRAALNSISPAATTMASLVGSVLMGWAYYRIDGGIAPWPLPGLLWFVAVGVVGGLGARYLSFVSINVVGLARTSILVQTSLIWSAAMAVFFLGEHISIGVGAGTVAIMFGSSLLLYKGDVTRKSIPLQNYLIPAMTALCLALSHLFLKFGFAWIPSAPLGMGVASSTALFLLLVFMPFTSEGVPRIGERRALLIVGLGTVLNGLAAVFFQSAVKTGRIVEVIPINRLSVLIVIFFSWVFFRQQEAITLRVVLGGLLSVVGAFAIVSGR